MVAIQTLVDVQSCGVVIEAWDTKPRLTRGCVQAAQFDNPDADGCRPGSGDFQREEQHEVFDNLEKSLWSVFFHQADQSDNCPSVLCMMSLA